MNRKWIAAAGVILSMGGAMTSWAEATPSQAEIPDWQWQEDSYSWKYVNREGEFKKKRWEKINGYWYYFDSDGYITTEWTEIRGINYCFRETGELELGWIYDEEEEKWYYFNEDGTVGKGWHQDGDGNWYWFSHKGEMASSGYKNILGKRYFFYNDGRLAANRYVGLFYMDENGVRNRDHDIRISGKKGTNTLPAEVKEGITEAVKNIPGEWMKRFIDQGWEIIYYPDKSYFSAPMTGNGTYFVTHVLDTNYKKIKICRPEALTEALGEYIGYASGCYKAGNQDGTDLLMGKAYLEEFVYIPDYFSDDLKFYFGKLAAAYVGSASVRAEIEEEAPEMSEILKRIIYFK